MVISRMEEKIERIEERLLIRELPDDEGFFPHQFELGRMEEKLLEGRNIKAMSPSQEQKRKMRKLE